MEKIEIRQAVETQPREDYVRKTQEEIQASDKKSARIKDNLNTANKKRAFGVYR